MVQAKSIYATGRRKTAAARVFLVPRTGEKSQILVNGHPYEEYFPSPSRKAMVSRPLTVAGKEEAFDLKITVSGGGNSGQAGAVLLGISRALLKVDAALREPLKKAGFLTRDPRAVERKKCGRHKARKRPQYSKR